MITGTTQDVRARVGGPDCALTYDEQAVHVWGSNAEAVRDGIASELGREGIRGKRFEFIVETPSDSYSSSSGSSGSSGSESSGSESSGSRSSFSSGASDESGTESSSDES